MTESKRPQLIPAAPDFWELSLVDCGGGEYETSRAPVVAWEMVVDDTSSDGNPPCYAYPVTTEGGRTHRGRVRIAEGCTYDSEENWLKEASAKFRARWRCADGRKPDIAIIEMGTA